MYINGSISPHIIFNETDNTTIVTPDQFLLTQICFSVTCVFLQVHIGTLICFCKARRLYGVWYFTSLVFRVSASLLTLTSCNLRVGSIAFKVVLIIANFCYLANLATETLSILNLCCNNIIRLQETTSVNTENSSSYFFCFKKHIMCCHDNQFVRVIVSLIFFIGLPFSMVLLRAFGGEDVNTVLPDILHAALADYSCSFYPSWGTIYYLLIPAQLLIGLQLAIIISAFYVNHRLGKDAEIHFNQPVVNKQQERLLAALKVFLGQLICWLLAFVAVFYASAMLWHMFTLCSALQSIFLATSCILSRAVVSSVPKHKPRETEFILNARRKCPT